MSGDSRDCYYSSSSRMSQDRHLPPIRDVVGDELERRPRPNPYAFGDVRGALPTASRDGQLSGDPRGLTLPPIQHAGYNSYSGSIAQSGTSASQRRRASEYPDAVPQHRDRHEAGYATPSTREPDYAYNVLRTSGTGSSLVHAIPPAPRAQGILRQGGVPSQNHEEDAEKRHKCEYCGKKFDRPSSLQVHMRTHTGSQPFACEWPGCERTFSVRSNMLRHWRSHERTEVAHYAAHGGGEDDDFNETHSRGNSSTSSSQTSGSAYFSSSRRR